MLRDLTSPERLRPLLAIAIVGKLLLLLLLLWEHNIPLSGAWYFSGGDTTGYTDPVESLLQGTGYQPDSRMPGYSLPYFLVRLLLAPHAALQTLVLLHVLASAVSVILMAKLALVLTGDRRAFRWTYWIALAATYTSFYDRCILTESFSALALLIAVYAVLAHATHGRTSYVIGAGISMAWLIFMKPVYLPVLAILAAALWFRRSVPWVRRVGTIALLGVPFLLAESAWIARNARVHGVFRPLTDGIFSPAIRDDVKYPMLQLMQAYGTSFIWWDPTAEIKWFGVRAIGEGPVDRPDGPPPLPDYVYTSACPLDTLELIADDIEVYYRDSLDDAKRSRALAMVTERCDRCMTAFKTERPFYYHIVSRLRLLKKFILVSGTSTLLSLPWGELGPGAKSIKIICTALYLGVIVPGFAWALISFFRRRTSPATRTVAAVIIYGVTIFPIVLRMDENRYLTTPYPLAIIFAVILGIGLRDRLSNVRRRSNTVTEPASDPATSREL